ncbi:MAG: hypothetical protein QOH05_3313 [Acetobacteraceae bacterium]|jgi:hypothetical protein|nr:hypothetical protein [Acetobacteraceae bacterium]
MQASAIRGAAALRMNAEARTEVRVAIGDHVDALGSLDIFQALKRLELAYPRARIYDHARTFALDFCAR